MTIRELPHIPSQISGTVQAEYGDDRISPAGARPARHVRLDDDLAGRSIGHVHELLPKRRYEHAAAFAVGGTQALSLRHSSVNAGRKAPQSATAP